MAGKLRFFDSLDCVDSKRENLEEHYGDRWDVQDKSVDYLNGLSTDQSCRSVNRDEEETNYRTHFKELEGHLMTYTAIHSGTKNIAQVTLSTGQGKASQDARASAVVTEAVNQNIFHYGTEFYTLLRQFGGEELAAGYVATIREKGKTFPTIVRHLLLPPNTRVDGKGIQYWIQPVKLTIQDLMDYQEGDEDDNEDGEGGYINKSGIKELLDILQKEVETSTETEEVSEHSWKDLDRDESKQAYWYFEVQKDNSVNKVLYIKHSGTNLRGEMEGSAVKIIEKKGCADRASDIIKIYPIGLLIAKEPIIDNCIGVMELIINQAVEQNMLKNKLYDLLSFNSTPRIFYAEGGKDEASKLNLNEQTVLSDKMSFGNNNQKVSTQDALHMNAMLDQETANMTGSSFANTGRDQALSSQYKDIVSEKAQFKASLTSYRFKLQDQFLTDIVYFILKEKTDKKEDDYLTCDEEGNMAVHSCLKDEGVKIKDYLKRVGGRLKYLTVTCDRTLSPADQESLSRQRAYLMTRLPSMSGEQRNYVLRKFDSAELGVDIADAINNAGGELDEDVAKQRTIARREIQTIKDYSMLDQIYPISDNDADETHLEEILLSIQASLIRGANGEWDNVRQIETAAKIAHGFMHLDRLSQQRTDSPEIVEEFAQKLEESRLQLEEFKAKLNGEGQDGEPSAQQLKVIEMAQKKDDSEFRKELEVAKLQQKDAQEARLAKGQQDKKEQNDRKQSSAEILGAGQVQNQARAMEK